MNRIAIAAAACALLLVAGAAGAQEDLARQAGCSACHSAGARKVGPSYKEIAARHKGKADAADKIAGELKSGKGHPPVKASDDDIKSLVSWILAM